MYSLRACRGRYGCNEAQAFPKLPLLPDGRQNRCEKTKTTSTAPRCCKSRRRYRLLRRPGEEREQMQSLITVRSSFALRRRPSSLSMYTDARISRYIYLQIPITHLVKASMTEAIHQNYTEVLR